ncbi:Imm61 family immunity protein [Paenarthrobacter sp. NPDC057355]|uniref:Imm61 family immunity protein n=1 Tax=Paenarthrobacter sp. NPDC057355 TaxID=3346105 RepID=UPI003642AE9E
MSNELKPMIDRLLETINAAGYSIVTSQDGSWCLYNLGGEVKMYLLQAEDRFVVSRAERSGEEEVFFASQSIVDIELALLHCFTNLFRRREHQPFLVATPVPISPRKAAPGFTVSHSPDGTWLLQSTAGAPERTGRMITLVEFSYYAHMRPYDLWKAMNLQEDSPFQPLT